MTSFTAPLITIGILVLFAGLISVSAGAQLDCNFETDFCGWTQTSDHKLWSRADEHYAYLANPKSSTGSKAVLLSPSITVSPPGACLDLWFRMHGTKNGSLKVYRSAHDVRKLLYAVSGDQGSSWKQAYITILNGDNFNIIIEATQQDVGEFAIDDIKYTNTGKCQTSVSFSLLPSTPVTLAATHHFQSRVRRALSTSNYKTVLCNFEVGICSWKQVSATDDLNWTRQYAANVGRAAYGPKRDHTNGNNGHYLVLFSTATTTHRKASIITTVTSNKLAAQCLTFYYNIGGTNAGQLDVYVFPKNQPLDNPEWSMMGPQGDTWLQASISIDDKAPYIIRFDAINGDSSQSHVAIDDIKLVDGFCADIMPPTPGLKTLPLGTSVRMCDFEDGQKMCGFTVDNPIDYSWRWINEQVDSETGPSNDHTYGTTKGHYVHADSSYGMPNDKSQLMSPIYDDRSTGATTMCMTFFYNMYGKHVKSLKIYMKPSGQTDNGNPVFDIYGNQGKRWIEGQVNIPSAIMAGSYQVIFEAVNTYTSYGDIAIDDISFSTGICPVTGKCSFEKDLCSWTNENGHDNKDWLRVMAAAAPARPSMDHTLQLSTGSYMFLSSLGSYKAGDKAWFRGTTFQPERLKYRCMKFWFFFSKDTNIALNVYTFIPSNHNFELVWHQTYHNQGLYWHEGHVPIKAMTQDYFVFIEGVYTASSINKPGGVGFDDISFSQSACSILPTSATPPKQPSSATTTEAPLMKMIDCDFEKDPCFYYSGYVKLSWTLKKKYRKVAGSGIVGDHTKKNAVGQYTYVKGTRKQWSTASSEITTSEVAPGKYCLKFYYVMNGAQVGKLSVGYVIGLNIYSPTWQRRTSQGLKWKYAEVDFHRNSPFKIMFKIKPHPKIFEGDVALDDISLVNGTCDSVPKKQIDKYTKMCTFENQEKCGFTLDQRMDFNWAMGKGTNGGLLSDHTVQVDTGSYAYVTAENRRKGSKAHLNAFLLPPNPSKSLCLRFWYHMRGYGMSTMNVYLKRNGVLGKPVWSRKNDQGLVWTEASVSIPPASSSTQIVFEALIKSPMQQSLMAIDDISTSSTDCSHPTNCDFDNGMCNWNNIFFGDDFDWHLTTKATAPIADHTKGQYMYISADSQSKGKTAQLVSQDIIPSAPSCLNFWFASNGNTVGVLNVWVKQSSDGSMVSIWSENKVQGSGWVQARAAIPTQTANYQVIFEFIRGAGQNGYMALDDIVFDASNPCLLTPSVAKPTVGPTMPLPSTTKSSTISMIPSVACDFENSMCGWTQTNNMWQRSHAGMVSKPTAPSGGTVYLYLKDGVGPNGATILSPTFSVATGQSKCFTMSYYMYGGDVDSLGVFDAVNLVSSRLFWGQTKSQGAKWNQMSLKIASTIAPIRIHLAITGTFTSKHHNGFIAIDDISLKDGDCQDSNGLTQLSCDFETQCQYTNDPGLQTQWKKGSFRPSPLKDHTMKSIFGHYMYVETTNSKEGDHALFTSGTTSSGGSHCLTFWYYMYGKNPGKLYIYKKGPKWTGNPFWSQSVTQRKQWKNVQIPLHFFTSKIQLVFKATVGKNPRSSGIAIDDIVVQKKTCTKPPLCDFDEGSLCGWNNWYTNPVSWVNHNGENTDIGPATDHTKHNKSGGYMYIETRGKSLNGKKTYLISETLDKTYSTYCFRFWYSMKKASTGQLTVSLANGSSFPGTTIWQSSKHKLRDWNYATVPVMSSGYFALVFGVTIGNSYGGIIALDDVTYSKDKCSIIPPDATPPGMTTAKSPTTVRPTSIVLPGNSPLNCNFEANLCGWANKAKGGWTWGLAAQKVKIGGAPITDHSTGLRTGHYVYLSMKDGKNGVPTRSVPSRNILVSPIITSKGYRCLRFWYNMANNVKKLTVFATAGTEPGTPHFEIIGSTGHGWKMAQIDIGLKGTYRVWLAGFKGSDGVDGVIAIDDFSLTDSFCEDNVPSSTVTVTNHKAFFCNFERLGICGFTLDNAATGKWLQLSGRKDTSNTAPATDHTTATIWGKYMFTSNATAWKEYTLVSPTFTKLDSDSCLSFYYQSDMYSKSILRVKIRRDKKDSSTDFQMLINSDKWGLGEVTIPSKSISSSFQVVFYILAEDSNIGVAIDDISLSVGSCAAKATCTFENDDTCGWTNSYNDWFDWNVFIAYYSAVANIPFTDHTSDSANGHFLYTEASESNRGKNAVLESEFLPATNGSCFSFWFYMNGLGLGTLRVLLAVNSIHNVTIWSHIGHQSRVWTYAQVPVISSTSSFWIAIEAVRGNLPNGHINIDDLSYGLYDCDTTPKSAEQPAALTGIRVTPRPPIATGIFDCNFDINFCHWTQDKRDYFDWRRQTNRPASSVTGPTQDRTGHGSFAYIKSSLRRNNFNKGASLLSPSIAAGAQCLTFWYFMWGENVNSLSVSSRGNRDLLMWYRNGTQGKQWIQANVNFNFTSAQQVKINARLGRGPNGDIAIDDVSIKPGVCPQTPGHKSEGSCDFENGLCGFTKDKTDTAVWNVVKKSSSPFFVGPSKDHTYQTEKGHYAFVTKSNKGTVAHLVTKSFSAGSSNLCQEFWYNMYGYSQGSLRVKMRKTTGDIIAWQKSGNQGKDWHRDEIQIPANSQNVQIVFEMVSGGKYESNTAIDDLVLRSGSCASLKGSCSFDYDLCSWSNIIEDDFDWFRNKGATGTALTGPFADHSGSGYYVYIETSRRGSNQREAILESELFSDAGSCFHFFYNMYGSDVGTLRISVVSYDITADPIQAVENRIVWQLSDNQGQEWKEGIVTVIPKNNLPYKVQILAQKKTSLLSFYGDIAVDDVRFVSMSKGSCIQQPSMSAPVSTPAPTTPVPTPIAIPFGFNCGFEEGFCGWHVLSKWTRGTGKTLTSGTGPSTDHSGKGYYIFIDTSAMTRGDSADISSPLLQSKGTYCFSFWYHMYGATVNTLMISLKNSNKGKFLWQIQGSQGDRWRQARLTISSSNTTSLGVSYKIAIVGLAGTLDTGDIAVDDVSLTAGKCTPLPGSPIDCSFGGNSMCGYSQDSIDTFDWTLMRGSNGTTRPPDHTTGGGMGYYMYLNPFGHNVGDIARIWSRPFKPKFGQCVSFWYYMYGFGVGSLQIAFTTKVVSLNPTPAWALFGSQGTEWIQETVRIPSHLINVNVKLLFTGTRGTHVLSYIVLDDIKLEDACENPGECTFENGKCGWDFKRTSAFQYSNQFIRTSGNRSHSVIANSPSVDHTTQTGKGNYAMFTSNVVDKFQGRNITIESEVLPSTQGSCFRFWYSSSSKNFGSLIVVMKTSTSVPIPVWKYASKSVSWSEGQVYMSSQNPFRIVIKLTVGGVYGYLALDDFSLTDGYCSTFPATAQLATTPKQLTTSAPTWIPLGATKSNLDCDFEDGLCKWTQSTSDKFNWTRWQGETPSGYTGPELDHTKKTEKGYYIYIEASNKQKNEDAKLISPVIKDSSPHCLVFWYHMHVEDIGKLQLSFEGSTLIWTKQGPQANRWIEATVDIKGTAPYRLEFDGVRGKHYTGDIALDDIRFLPGSCSSDSTVDRCNFEEDNCGYSGGWTRVQGADKVAHITDHSYGTQYGHFLFLNKSPGTMDSLMRSSQGSYCVSYWYSLLDGASNVLSVISNGNLLAIHNGGTGKWIQGETTVTAYSSWQLTFSATFNSTTGYAAVDDIEISKGACGDMEGTCNFEADTCQWMSQGQAWSRSVPIFHTPNWSDHTNRKLKKGYFMILKRTALKDPISGNLDSRIMNSFEGIKCFSFWYFRYSYPYLVIFQGSLEVSIIDKNSNNAQIIWKLPKSSSLRRWNLAHVPIPSQKTSYRIRITGTVYKDDLLGLDDFRGRISTKESCPVLPVNADKVATPVTVKTTPPTTLKPFVSHSKYDCGFESGFCSWNQASSPYFGWRRGTSQQRAEEIGPIYDHNTQTENGYYIYLSTSDKLTDVKLHSAVFPSGTKGCLKLYFYMHFPQGATFNIYWHYVSDKSGRNLLSTKRGNFGDHWLPLRLNLSHMSSGDYVIVLEGVSGPINLGTLAVDDIRVQLGDTCSAEAGPGCSFDFGSCGWIQDTKTDTLDWEYKTQPTTITGISADHSLGTPAGSYYYLDFGKLEKQSPKNFAFLVSPTITMKKDLCMRFYYIMNWVGSGLLEVGYFNALSSYSVFQFNGQKSSEWRMAEVTILNKARKLSVYFKGVDGNGGKAIAIDDVSFREGKCPYSVDNTFENGLDGYTNTADGDKFDWIAMRSSYLLGAFADHTLRSTEGLVAFADGEFEIPGSNAYLYTPEMSGAATSCVSLYYRFDRKHHPTLNVHMYNTISRTMTLIGTVNSFKPEWSLLRFPIPPQNNPFKLVFEAVVGNPAIGTVSIDDVTVQTQYCRWFPASAQHSHFSTVTWPSAATTISTRVASPYDCDFDKGNTCKWTMGQNKLVKWSLLKGKLVPHTMYSTNKDHSLGTDDGYLLHMQMVKYRRNNISCSLVSPVINAHGSGVCLSFWYRMYGPKVSKLSVDISEGLKRYRIWTQQGTHGPEWKYAQMTFKGPENFRFLIVGRTYNQFPESVDLDDIQFLPTPCSNTLFSLGRSCDFETGMCGFTQSKTAALVWTIPPSLSKTAADHTLKTNFGNYLYLEGKPNAKGIKASVVSLDVTLKKQTTACLRFFYLMDGKTSVSLNVYQVYSGRFPLRQISGIGPSAWMKEEVNVLWKAGSFKIEFEGIVEANGNSYIALDDLSLTLGACNVKGCDFDHETCTWYQSTEDDLDWMRNSGRTTTILTGPDKDHTIGGPAGYYMFVESSSPAKEGDKALLLSKAFPSGQAQCFHFFYFMYGFHMGTLNVYVKKAYAKTGPKNLVWSLSGNQAESWSAAFVAVNFTSSYQIVLEGVVGPGHSGDIAVDDVLFFDGVCGISPLDAAPVQVTTSVTTTPSVTTAGSSLSTSKPTTFDCDFEHDFCSWTLSKIVGFKWLRGLGRTQSPSTGPYADHTLGNAQGYYAYIEASSPAKFKDTARLTSAVIPPGQRCLRFYYFMYGPDIYQLNVYLQQGGSSTKIFKREGDVGLQWLPATVNLNPTGSYQIVIEAIRGKGYGGDIAIDDITVPTGPCPEISAEDGIINCDFESSNQKGQMCSFVQNTLDDFDWSLNSGSTKSVNTGPYIDHTYQTTYGHYIYIEGSFRKENDRALLVSQVYTFRTAPQHCLTFYYHMQGRDMGTLNVYLFQSGVSWNFTTPLWTRSHQFGSNWRKGEVTLQLFWNYQILFEGVIGKSHESDIAVDDISITNIPCPSSMQCQFTKDMCLWHNVAKDDFDWVMFTNKKSTLDAASVYDHTTGNGKGSYIAIQNDIRKPSQTARLFSQSLDTDKEYCLFFWYYMNGADAGTLRVYMKSDGVGDAISTETHLWQVTGQMNDKWMPAQVSIDKKLTKKPFVLVIEAVVGNGTKGFMGIDDTSIDDISCITTPYYARTNDNDVAMADCNFDTGTTCLWNQNYFDDVEWVSSNVKNVPVGMPPDRAGHGNGYIFVGSQEFNQEAVLSSPIMPSTNGRSCFTFWYYLSNVNAKLHLLSDIAHVTKEEYRARTPMTWKKASVTIDSHKSYRLFMKGEKYDVRDIVAVDDFTLYPGHCLPEGMCTFEGDMCDFIDYGKADFLWKRKKVGSDAQGYHGYSVYAEAPANENTAQKARLISPKMPGAEDLQCLRFEYFLYGDDHDYLSVYLKETSASIIQIWSTRFNRGKRWVIGEATIYSKNSFQVGFEFEAGVGNGNPSHLALDNLMLLTHECPPRGSCSFTRDSCTYFNQLGNSVDWVFESARTLRSTGPALDHTNNVLDGGYAQSSFLSGTDVTSSVLVSDILLETTGQCLVFSYYIFGETTLRVALVRDTTNKTEILENLNNPSSDTTEPYKIWRTSQVDIRSNDTYFIKFISSKFWRSSSGSVSLDDIKLLEGLCSLQKSTVHPTTAPIPQVPISSLSCDFEMSNKTYCSYIQDTTEKANWTRRRGSTWTLDTGPIADHTFQNDKGHYVYLETSYVAANTEARLISPSFSSSMPRCLSFWYNMYGTSVNKFNVYVTNEHWYDDPVWTRQGDHGIGWKEAFVTLDNVYTNAKIVFEAVSGHDYHGDIALDDVKVLEGPCSRSDDCDFEDSNMCHYYQDNNDDFDWSRKAGSTSSKTTGPATDTTYGTSWGHYMSIGLSSKHKPGDVARLVSPMYKYSTGRCLTFKVNMDTRKASGSLKVLVLEGMSESPKLDFGSTDFRWATMMTEIQSDTDHQIVFQGVVDNTGSGFIAIDDIQLTSTKCAFVTDCDFESGLCAWSQSKTDEKDWHLHAGRTPYPERGPSIDHTIGKRAGQYIILRNNNVNITKGSTGVLESSLFPLASVKSCFTFWYYMETSYVGSLNVTMQGLDNDNTAPTSVFYIEGNQGWSWKQALVTLPLLKSKYIKLAIVGTTNKYNGDIALDDFKLYDTSCSEAVPPPATFSCGGVQEQMIPYSKVCDFKRDCTETHADESSCGDCSFESGYCNWMIENIGEFQWSRGSGAVATPNTGPFYDHLRNSKGHYLFVEASDGQDSGPVELITNFKFGPSPLTCQIQFYYGFKGIGQLTVVLRESMEDSIIYITSPNTGKDWSKAIVDLGRVAVNFKILFRAKRYYGTQGHIAIDDISFINCNYPASQTSCKPDEFHCHNKACVPNHTLCDYSNDCGDGSDELACDNYSLRTNFEYSLGSWMQDTNDDFDWTRQRGYTDTFMTGTTRDHTRGTVAGHYVHINTSSKQRGDAARLISPVLSVATGHGTCNLRLYYFMFGTSSGGILTVYTQTTIGGPRKSVFTKSFTYGEQWNRADILLPEKTDFQIVLEATVGKGSFGDIAVDDISLSPGCKLSSIDILPTAPPTPPTTTSKCGNDFTCGDHTCVSKSKVCNYVNDCSDKSDEAKCGSCDFSSDSCGWEDASTNLYTWSRVGALDQVQNQPKKDADGHKDDSGFFAAPIKVGSGQWKEPPSTFLSPVLQRLGPSCHMIFSYYYINPGSGYLDIGWQFYSFLGLTSTPTLQRFAGKDVVQGKWTTASMFIGQLAPGYQIMMRYTPGSQVNDNSFLAVDNIVFKHCQPDHVYQPTKLDCSFMGGNLCAYFQSIFDNFDWGLTNNSTESRATGPSGDHTTGHGYYAFIETSYPHEKGESAELISALQPWPSDEMCLTFWYHMFGESVATMNVYLITGYKHTLIWTRSDSQGNIWKKAFASVKTDKNYQIAFRGNVGTSHTGDIGLDDISLSPGKCPPQPICDFEIDLCGYTQLTTDKLNWIRRYKSTPTSGTGPVGDHTTKNGNGHYIYIEATGNRRGDNAQLMSPVFKVTKDQPHCVNFWYHMQGIGIGSLNVYAKTSDTQLHRIWSKSGSAGNHWYMGRATVKASLGDVNIIFEGVRGKSYRGDIALDDISVQKGACDLVGTCDFEVDTCGMFNMVKHSEWLRTAGSTAGPSGDHTTNSDAGFYMIFESNGLQEQHAQLYTDYINPTTQSCFSFWYFMYGKDVGTLQVMLKNTTGTTVIWSLSNNQGQKWLNAQVSIISPVEFQIGLSAKVGFHAVFGFFKTITKENIAIDDTKMSKGPCVKSTTAATVTKTATPATTTHTTACANYCHSGGICTIGSDGLPHCKCVNGYTGKRCDTSPAQHTQTPVTSIQSSTLKPVPTTSHPVSETSKDKLPATQSHHSTPTTGAGGGVISLSTPQTVENQGQVSSGGSGSWKTPVGVVVGLLVVVALAGAVFFYLRKTNRLGGIRFHPFGNESLKGGLANPVYEEIGGSGGFAMQDIEPPTFENLNSHSHGASHLSDPSMSLENPLYREAEA